MKKRYFSKEKTIGSRLWLPHQLVQFPHLVKKVHFRARAVVFARVLHVITDMPMTWVLKRQWASVQRIYIGSQRASERASERSEYMGMRESSEAVKSMTYVKLTPVPIQVAFSLLLVISARLSRKFCICVYVYLHDCVILSFLLLLVIGIGLPLFCNFGRTFLCICAHRCVCVHARTGAWVCVCFAASRHWDSVILLIPSARMGACACECTRVRV